MKFLPVTSRKTPTRTRRIISAGSMIINLLVFTGKVEFWLPVVIRRSKKYVRNGIFMHIICEMQGPRFVCLAVVMRWVLLQNARGPGPTGGKEESRFINLYWPSDSHWGFALLQLLQQAVNICHHHVFLVHINYYCHNMADTKWFNVSSMVEF